MSEINSNNISREEIINTLVDLFNIREPIEAYNEWLKMPLKDLLLIYISETDNYNNEDCFYE